MLKKLTKWIDPLANPDTTSGLDEVVGTFDLNRARLYVALPVPMTGKHIRC